LAVVSNTSPLTNLLAIDRFQLLSQLYDVVAAPEAVVEEITIDPDKPGPKQGQIPKEELSSLSWLETKQVDNHDLVRSLTRVLDSGESEAIALALETEAELLLIDERKGRDVARQMGVNPTGLLGVLIEAKDKEIITNVKPVLDSLRVDAGFWISEELYHRVLREVEEGS